METHSLLLHNMLGRCKEAKLMAFGVMHMHMSQQFAGLAVMRHGFNGKVRLWGGRRFMHHIFNLKFNSYADLVHSEEKSMICRNWIPNDLAFAS